MKNAKMVYFVAIAFVFSLVRTIQPIVNHDSKVIQAIDIIRELGLDELTLPKIVVVGDQSSGKSSILESLSGISLPKGGQKMTTKVPIVLELKNDNTEIAVFNETIYMINETEKYVSLFQEEILSQVNESVVDKPINLKVSSPEILADITLVDLPGLRYGLDKKNQYSSKKVREIIKKYISNERTIILLVIPSNVDLDTLESIKLVKQKDPDFRRSIAVVTKVDIMEKGIEDQLAGKLNKMKFKNGVVFVKNRDVIDRENGMTITESREKEKDFFANIKDSLKGNFEFGTDKLAKKLSLLLSGSINEHLPQMKIEIQVQIGVVERKIDRLSKSIIPDEEKERRRWLMNKFNTFSQVFYNVLTGVPKKSTDELTDLEGLKIIYSCLNDFKDAVRVVNDVNYDNDERRSIKIKIKESEKPISGFLSYELFQNEVYDFIKKMEHPSMNTLNAVKLHVENLVNEILSINDFHPVVSKVIKEMFFEEIKKQYETCKMRIFAEIEKENFIFADKEKLELELSNAERLNQKKDRNGDTKTEEEKMIARIVAYRKIILEGLINSINKHIGFSMVNKLTKRTSEIHFNMEFIDRMNEKNLFNKEYEDKVSEIKKLKEKKKILSKSMNVLLKL